MPKRDTLDPKQIFLSQLREWRVASGISQVELGARIGWLQEDISKVERGLRRLDVLELRAWMAGLEAPLLAFVEELDERLAAQSHLQAGWPAQRGAKNPS